MALTLLESDKIEGLIDSIEEKKASKIMQNLNNHPYAYTIALCPSN